ncbi:hypothetical protein [Streptomyces sp. NPDC007917]|uniref:hypothetical protein n=1 Tax=Streptomyces sp. NPDC007917 TaxID=3364793 RepID=UPI0036E45DA0
MTVNKPSLSQVRVVSRRRSAWLACCAATYDGDANGSNYLQTKVQPFNRTRKG